MVKTGYYHSDRSLLLPSDEADARIFEVTYIGNDDYGVSKAIIKPIIGGPYSVKTDEIELFLKIGEMREANESEVALFLLNLT
jgi:hypothetical protein